MHDPVVTPEAVALDLEPATVGSRSVAIVLDYLIMLTGFLLLSIAEAVFGFGGFVPNWLGIALLLLLVFALQFGYPIGFETLWRGRTPGKAAMGLRVVTLEGAPVRFRHAAVRAAVGVLELVMTLGAIAVITSFASPRGQRLGDLAAGTMVVRERSAGGQPRVSRFEPPRGLEEYVRILDVSRLGAADYATVRDLLRRPLDPATREGVARQVADGLVGRVQPPPPGGIDAATWLACVAAAVQARGAGRLDPGGGPPRSPVPGGPLPSHGPGSDASGAEASEPGPLTRSRSGAGRVDPAPPRGADDDEPGPPPPPATTGFRPPE